MNKIRNVVMIPLVSLALLTGCATNDGPSYEGNTYKNIRKVEVGVITHDRPIVIKDDGTGAFLGMLVGAVIGSQIGGSSDANTVGMIAGGVAGNYVGAEMGKANGDELKVKLTTGETVIVVVKGKHFKVGDKVQIIKDGEKVSQIELVK